MKQKPPLTPLAPPPPGRKWVFCTRRWHVGAQRYLYAKDYGRDAWCFLGRKKG